MKVGYEVKFEQRGIKFFEQFPEKCLADEYAKFKAGQGYKGDVIEFVYE